MNEKRAGRDGTHRDDFLVDLDGVRALAVGVLEGDHLEHAHPERVYVDQLVVLFFIHLRCHELGSPHAVHSVGLAEDGSKAEVPDLDLARVAVDEDVVAFEIAVDDGRVVAVEVGQSAQDLAAPVLDGT